jgi:nitric oxide reductase activation protein
MELEKRSEARRVLIVLSDGLPSAYYKESEAIADVRSAVQEARRRGIVVIPIMYGVTDSAESFQAYQQMYEKGIISTNAENILSEFEKLIFRLIK